MLKQQLSLEFVEKKVRSLSKLSTLPHLATKVMELVENPKTSASRLAHIISNDQILAARILKLANSAYYGFPRKISTLNLAIVVLGFNALRDLVLSISVIDQFIAKGFSDKFEPDQFWRHALIVGRGARVLSKYVNYPVAGEVFVAGLLHDIGYPVLLQQFPEEFKNAYHYAEERDVSFNKAETKLIGFTHTDLGGWLAEGWNLPEKLVNAIRYHHTPEKNHFHQDLVNIIHVADLISYSIGEGSGIKNVEEISVSNIEEKIAKFFPRNGYPLSFFQDKFREECEKVNDFLEILTQEEVVE